MAKGYTLIISEKPSASKRIAEALADGKIETVKKGKVSYFRLKRGDREIVVCPAVGHLFVLDEKNGNSTGKWKYPVFETEWKPTFSNKNSAWAEPYYRNFATLSKNAADFISACDYDIEGSTIAYNILRFICKTNKGRRMKFSTLTKEDIVKAYDEASKTLDFPQIEAGLARHELDFLWGINLSRALTISLEKAGGFWTLSTGRVQGPTLKILDEREREIEEFVPDLYWQLELNGKITGEAITAIHIKDRFWEKDEAEKSFRKAQGKPAVVESVVKKEQKQAPPTPFDLTTLQRESFRNFSYSPKMTLDLAQSLYENALISYPRTSSQKLPQKLGLRKIMESLSSQEEYRTLCAKLLKGKLTPNEGEKDDSAHPSIFPTGNPPKKLNNYEKRVYDLIVRRFLAVFSDPAVREHMAATFDVNGEKFRATGARTVVRNWMEYYGKYAGFKDQTLPGMKKGDRLESGRVDMLEKETTPPSRYSQASILKMMEDLGLGTKATRAGILQTLYDREYIREKSIQVTPLGSAVARSLKNHFPEVISEELTRRFESQMEMIQDSKKKREEVIREAKGELSKVLEKFKGHEEKIGLELLEGVKEFEEIVHYVGPCEKCGGELRVIHSHFTHKRFVGCSGYPKCRNGFPLPQKGKLEVIPEKCPKCGLGIVQVIQSGRRPWRLCVRHGFSYKSKDDAKGDVKTKAAAKKKKEPQETAEEGQA